ncbi:MAG: hypothetical protein HYY18_06520 [Planctomycetes bacterium]|nr:hypothetical protein [Planctomycetota bacterium]
MHPFHGAARRRAVLVPVLIALAAVPAAAGNDGFFTTYTHHVEKGEAELMIMSDFTNPSKFKREEGQGDYFSQMIEFEYGLTEQLAVELMLEAFEDVETGEAEFTGYRLEARYRIFKQDVPLNPMVYVEYEDLHPETRFKMEVSGWIDPPYHEDEEEEPVRERILESRLILSQEIGPVVVAFNAIFETDVHGGGTAFGYSIGAMYHPGGWGGHGHSHIAVEAGEDKKSDGCACATEMKGCRCAHCADDEGECPCSHAGSWAIGIEMYGALGDTRKFGWNGDRQEHYLGPVFMYHFTPQVGVHVALGIGLTNASDDLFRLALAIEF